MPRLAAATPAGIPMGIPGTGICRIQNTEYRIHVQNTEYRVQFYCTVSIIPVLLYDSTGRILLIV